MLETTELPIQCLRKSRINRFIKHLLSDQHERGVEKDTKESEIMFYPLGTKNLKHSVFKNSLTYNSLSDYKMQILSARDILRKIMLENNTITYNARSQGLFTLPLDSCSERLLPYTERALT